MFGVAEFEADEIGLPAPKRRRVAVAPLPAEARRCDVLIVGGGVIGLATARDLARDGADVLIADRDEAGLASSTANAGSLHVQLHAYDFAYPGAPADGGPACHVLPLGPPSIALWRRLPPTRARRWGSPSKAG